MPIHGSPWKGPLYGLWRSKRARPSDLSRISVVLRPASEGQSHSKECVELELAPWRRRGRWHRLKDNALYLFNEMM